MFSEKMIAGILTAVMMSAGGGVTTPDAEALLQKANETMSQVESMSAVMERQMDVDFDGETASTIIQSNIETLSVPFKFNAEVTVMRNHEVAQKYGVYAMEKDSGIEIYSEIEDLWVHEVGTKEDISQYDIWTQQDRFLRNLTSVEVDGTEEINGIQTTKISGALTGEAIECILSTSGIDLVFAGLGWSLEEWNGELKRMEELPVNLWVSVDGYLIRYEFDMTTQMQTALDRLNGKVENFQTIEKTKLRVTCGDFNQVPEVEIPAEVLSGAQEFDEFWQNYL